MAGSGPLVAVKETDRKAVAPVLVDDEGALLTTGEGNKFLIETLILEMRAVRIGIELQNSYPVGSLLERAADQ